jgi:hypothetical protein
MEPAVCFGSILCFVACPFHCVNLTVDVSTQVLPGGRIPADGQLVVGSSYINEAMITGESQPVMKGKGDALIGGTINTGKHLDATRLYCCGCLLSASQARLAVVLSRVWCEALRDSEQCSQHLDWLRTC